jgi:hypothetical protein
VSCGDNDERQDLLQHNNFHDWQPSENRWGAAQPTPPEKLGEGWFSSATNVTTFSHAGFEIFED